MTLLRVSEAARYLGVSDDTVRRWVTAGRLTGRTDDAGKAAVDGVEVAALAREASNEPDDQAPTSARNTFAGLVTRVVMDTVMAQVELQCGPFRVVSLMSAEAARELGLEPGMPATAVVKATTVIINRETAP
ncbi:TOBE domain-containing protein [Microbacterium sp. A93]|uniref:TOBE domain-containing protein n=1 Tax=Microbacterium sp. A93 TaxID=3450716 RepID=UPI003F43BCF7